MNAVRVVAAVVVVNDVFAVVLATVVVATPAVVVVVVALDVFVLFWADTRAAAIRTARATVRARIVES